MADEKNNCDIAEVNSKTKIGLTFKEAIYIIAVICGIGVSYADIKSDLEDLRLKYITIEQKQTTYDADIRQQREVDSENIKNIFIQLEQLRGDLKLKKDKE